MIGGMTFHDSVAFQIAKVTYFNHQWLDGVFYSYVFALCPF